MCNSDNLFHIPLSIGFFRSSVDAISNLVTEWRQESKKQQMMSSDISQSALNTEESRLTLCSLLLSDALSDDVKVGVEEYITESVVSLCEKSRQSMLYSVRVVLQCIPYRMKI